MARDSGLCHSDDVLNAYGEVCCLVLLLLRAFGHLRVVGGRDQVHTNFFDRNGCFIPDVDHVLVTHVSPHIHSALVR